jgi:hypothetical protein
MLKLTDHKVIKGKNVQYILDEYNIKVFKQFPKMVEDVISSFGDDEY